MGSSTSSLRQKLDRGHSTHSMIEYTRSRPARTLSFPLRNSVHRLLFSRTAPGICACQVLKKGRELHRKLHGTEPPAPMLTEFVICGTDLDQCERESRLYQGKFVESNFYHYEFLGEHFASAGLDPISRRRKLPGRPVWAVPSMVL